VRPFFYERRELAKPEEYTIRCQSTTWLALVEDKDDDENEDDNGKRREAGKRGSETRENLGDGATHLYFI
jgi:hypothetical protein